MACAARLICLLQEKVVSSADVGYVQQGELVHVQQIVVDACGNQRAQIDRGWVTISAGQSLDERTSGTVRLVPAEEPESGRLAFY